MTTDQAAAYLACKPDTLRGWVREGLVPFHKLPGGRHLRFHTAELDAAMGLDVDGVTARSWCFAGTPDDEAAA
jgi:excisionase family DNA binding protein